MNNQPEPMIKEIVPASREAQLAGMLSRVGWLLTEIEEVIRDGDQIVIDGVFHHRIKNTIGAVRDLVTVNE